MPRHVARWVQQQPGLSARMQIATTLLMLVPMLAGFASAVWLMHSVAFLELFIACGIVTADTLLMDVELFGLLGLIFAAIFAAGAISCAITFRYRELSIQGAAISIKKLMTQAPRWFRKFVPGMVIRRISSDLEPEDYMMQYVALELRFATACFFGSILLTIVGVIWDGGTASIATPEGIYAGHHFRFARTFFSWDKVTGLETGCYYSNNGTVRNTAYRIHLPNGETADFSSGPSPGDAGNRLQTLSRIDTFLRQSQVPWKPAVYPGGTMAGQTQWHPECFEAFRADYSPEDWLLFKRVYRYEPRE